MTGIRALTQRFDRMRNSGVCSPTTRGLLDDAQAALEAQEAKITEALKAFARLEQRTGGWPQEVCQAHAWLSDDSKPLETVESSDQEREALIEALQAPTFVNGERRLVGWEPIADSVLAAGFHRQGSDQEPSNPDEKSRTHCRECREGKHGACDGSMYNEVADVVEACLCASYDWDGEHTNGGGR